jgi:hypothetical protein
MGRIFQVGFVTAYARAKAAERTRQLRVGAPLAANLAGLIDAEGRSCIYVPITQDGQVVDSQGYALELDDE